MRTGHGAALFKAAKEAFRLTARLAKVAALYVAPFFIPLSA
jgi:hypothetical protein